MAKVKVAVAGVGNCDSALIQGIQYYRKNPPKEDGRTTGLMHPSFGPYKIEDISFVAAFEVNRRKIGTDLSKAIFTEPNCGVKISDVPDMGVTVTAGPILDGVAPHMRETFQVYNSSRTKPVDVAAELKDSGADLLVNYLPVGSEKAARFYAQQALDAGCGFVNCIPEFLATNEGWAKKFEDRKLLIAGDDIKGKKRGNLPIQICPKAPSRGSPKQRRISRGCHPPHKDCTGPGNGGRPYQYPSLQLQFPAGQDP